MKPYRFTLLAAAMILAFTLAACGPAATPVVPTSTPIKVAQPVATEAPTPTTAPAGTPTTSATAAASGGCSNAYYPITAGATWAYASTGSVAGAYTYTRMLSDLSDTGFTAVDTFSGGTIRSVKWTCDSGNLANLSTGSGNGAVTAKTTTLTVDTVNAAGYAIPNAFTDGKTWSEDLNFNGTLMRDGAQVGTAVNENKTGCAIAGTESVKVPAGDFDTVKVTCHSSLVTTATVSGLTLDPVTTVTDSTDWYAKGVGIVKTVDMGDGGNETITLTRYTIP